LRSVLLAAGFEDHYACGKTKGDRIYGIEGVFCFSTFRLAAISLAGLPAVFLAGMKVLKAIHSRGAKASAFVRPGDSESVEASGLPHLSYSCRAGLEEYISRKLPF
jgi:hypothetical protein